MILLFFNACQKDIKVAVANDHPVYMYIYVCIVCVILKHVNEIVIDFHPVSEKT